MLSCPPSNLILNLSCVLSLTAALTAAQKDTYTYIPSVDYYVLERLYSFYHPVCMSACCDKVVLLDEERKMQLLLKFLNTVTLVLWQ